MVASGEALGMAETAGEGEARVSALLAQPASRERARDRERVFFRKLCIVCLRESIYCDYTILWLWRKGDAAGGQDGLFARRPP